MTSFECAADTDNGIVCICVLMLKTHKSAKRPRFGHVVRILEYSHDNVLE